MTSSTTAPEQAPVPLWNIANILTMIRCVMVPLFVVVAAMYETSVPGRFVVCAIFVIAMITDFLDGHLAAESHQLDAVVSLQVNPNALVDRLLERARIENRADDNEDTIRRRMEVYAGQTAPLLFHYEHQGILVDVDGTGSIEDVRERMFTAVDAHHRS